MHGCTSDLLRAFSYCGCAAEVYPGSLFDRRNRAPVLGFLLKTIDAPGVATAMHSRLRTHLHGTCSPQPPTFILTILRIPLSLSCNSSSPTKWRHTWLRAAISVGRATSTFQPRSPPPSGQRRQSLLRWTDASLQYSFAYCINPYAHRCAPLPAGNISEGP